MGTVLGMDRAQKTAQKTSGAPRDQRNGEPGRRALAAMANAAGRARRSGNGAGVANPDEKIGSRRLVARSSTGGPAPDVGRGTILSPPRPPSPAPEPPRPPGVGPPPRVDWRTRWGLDSPRTPTLLLSVVVGVLALAVVALALALTLQSPSKPATRRVGAEQRPPSSHPTKGSGTTSGRSTTGGTAPTTTSPPAAAPTGAPRLATASPASGGAGQTVVVDGSGLFSTNGEVQAYFGGDAAPTSCTTQTSCTVTVPDLGSGPSTVRLTVVTSRGRSNGVSFHYA